MKSLWKNYSLSIVLTLLFIGSWAMQGVFQWQEFSREEEENGQIATISNFIPPFFSSTFENWQSEFLQLLSFVTLTTFLVHKGSPESKDGDEKMEKLLKEIKMELKRKNERR